MLPAAHAFTRLVIAELLAQGQADQFSTIVGAEVSSVQGIEDSKQLGPLVKRWNVYAGEHPPLCRVAFYDRGFGSEISMGHRGAGKVYP